MTSYVSLPSSSLIFANNSLDASVSPSVLSAAALELVGFLVVESVLSVEEFVPVVVFVPPPANLTRDAIVEP